MNFEPSRFVDASQRAANKYRRENGLDESTPLVVTTIEACPAIIDWLIDLSSTWYSVDFLDNPLVPESHIAFHIKPKPDDDPMTPPTRNGLPISRN
jgi:hypothetical protein